MPGGAGGRAGAGPGSAVQVGGCGGPGRREGRSVGLSARPSFQRSVIRVRRAGARVRGVSRSPADNAVPNEPGKY